MQHPHPRNIPKHPPNSRTFFLCVCAAGVCRCASSFNHHQSAQQQHHHCVARRWLWRLNGCAALPQNRKTNTRQQQTTSTTKKHRGKTCIIMVMNNECCNLCMSVGGFVVRFSNGGDGCTFYDGFWLYAGTELTCCMIDGVSDIFEYSMVFLICFFSFENGVLTHAFQSISACPRGVRVKSAH